ncbi:LLM class flavin-dependent oxidoreductase [Streptomyces sp. NPDC046324]|uniref:LLM class flavin-dependent oxidoreductase n=1 Tax=Streptomyces sp. NPDC046324 TaxID=3154915 RepID=UPI0033C1A9E2
MSAPSAPTPPSFAAPPLRPHLHLAVALDGAARNPAAWRREPGARSGDPLTLGSWTDLVTEAESGLLDFVTIEGGFGPRSPHPTEPDDPTDQGRGRLDAVLVAARVARHTRHIGLVPTVVATHTEPFQVAKAIATLDHVSNGRAGLRIQVSARRDEAARVGRRTYPRLRAVGRDTPAGRELIAELFDEASHHVEMVRRLWDSGEEEEGEARDVRSVRGSSVTPRPPQGQPVVSASAHGSVPFGLVGRSADIGYVTPRDADRARAVVAEIRTAQTDAGRAEEPLHVFGDLVVFLDADPAAAEDRRARLGGLAGEARTDGATVFTGTPGHLADLLLEWRATGLTGFRLRPGTIAHDLERITRELVPELQRRGAFRHAYEADTLRGLLGLGRPAERRATARLAGAVRR